MQQALDLIKTHYQDFGPTLAHDKLVELHRMQISDERIRQLMIAEGLWKSKKARQKRVYQMRVCRICRGALDQIDGSDFAWFQERGPRYTDQKGSAESRTRESINHDQHIWGRSYIKNG
jgi:hypothetical protein